MPTHSNDSLQAAKKEKNSLSATSSRLFSLYKENKLYLVAPFLLFLVGIILLISQVPRQVVKEVVKNETGSLVSQPSLIEQVPYPTELSEGPFGLNWGESKSDIENKGITLQAFSSEGQISSFKTNHLPKDLSIAEQYILYFDKKYNLQRITMVSKDIDNDLYGSEGKKIFSDIKSKLAQKYGNSTGGLEVVGIELYKEQNEFYQCLSYEGCGAWNVLYDDKKQGISVLLELVGMRRGKGYIKINYEGPNWSNALNAFRQKKSELDAGSL